MAMVWTSSLCQTAPKRELGKRSVWRMAATYTFDVFMSVDGYSSYKTPGDWGGYWGKQGPELIARREFLYGSESRMVFGATTFRDFVAMLNVGRSGEKPVFQNAADFDLEPLESRTLDGRSQELVYRSTLRRWPQR